MRAGPARNLDRVGVEHLARAGAEVVVMSM